MASPSSKASKKAKTAIEVYLACGSGKAGASAAAIRSAYKIEVRFVGGLNTDQKNAFRTAARLVDVITHEMGHVIGIGTIWTHKGLWTGAGTANPRFTGARRGRAPARAADLRAAGLAGRQSGETPRA